MWKPSKKYLNNLSVLYGDKSPVKLNTVRKVKRSRKSTESSIQIAIVQWARLQGLLLLSIPNHGKRSPWLGERERLMGLMAGASDLLLAMASGCGKYHGFFLEIKAPGKKPTALQLEFMEKARAQGYKAEWFDDPDEAISDIKEYLSGMPKAA